MYDLKKLGFGPPDIGLPTGNCNKGHLWANNFRLDRNGHRKCATCDRLQRAKYSFKKKFIKSEEQKRSCDEEDEAIN